MKLKRCSEGERLFQREGKKEEKDPKSNTNSFRFEFEFIKKIRRMNLSDRIGNKKIENPGTRSKRDGGTHGCRRRRDPHTVERQHHTARNRQEKTPIVDTKFKSPQAVGKT